MFTSNTAKLTKSSNIFVAGIKLYDVIKKALKPAIHTNNSSKECLPYIVNVLAKGFTVLDVGYHKKEYIFNLVKLSKLPGKIIAFETNEETYNYLNKRKQLMKLDNIIIEDLFIATENREATASVVSIKSDNTAGAAIIDFNLAISKKRSDVYDGETIANYCSLNFIIPALIKFKLEKDLNVLQGAKEVLQKYKPQIIIECTEGKANRDTMLSVFKFLTELHYAGFFILDTIKIPLANFDFNTYQNEVLGFYCNNFIFE